MKEEFSSFTWSRTKTEKWKNNKKWKIATLNIQGLNAIGKRQEIEKWMEDKKIDIPCVQETKFNHNSTESRKGFT
eukprot:6823992-Karenia_brevis.AAC.1